MLVTIIILLIFICSNIFFIRVIILHTIDQSSIHHNVYLTRSAIIVVYNFKLDGFSEENSCLIEL